MNDVGLLLSTCARYAGVAEETAKQIPVFWPGHPPIFWSGVERDGALPLRDDPADWMAVTRSAVADLAGRGFRWIYLILDDHPPIAPCNAGMLNEGLPAAAERLRAVNIGLLGWGQRRDREGDRPEGVPAGLSRNSPAYRWKFSLHPALWSVSALLELLDARIEQFPSGARTPWNFERHRDERGGPVPDGLLENTYRLNGFHSGGIADRELIATKEAALFGYDLFRFALRISRGSAARERFDKKGLWLYHIYLGPYPLFWSGVVRGGKPSPEFAVYFKIFGRFWMGKAWGDVGGLLRC